MVVSRRETTPSACSRVKTQSVPATITHADERQRASSRGLMMGSLARRGGRRMTVGSTGSTPSDCAGGPSMMMLIHRICIALSGLA